eukprot:TRINITY_DN17721_c0_g1_i1.p1 TRINITY_DN17721_c0_g1~~TRINITY_DN17721_c0_g1_i1.p1  ORF type:complete len:582 (-),score=174.48 TRINITY_DN17721_c0_g1_i1:94-1839(-)
MVGVVAAGASAHREPKVHRAADVSFEIKINYWKAIVEIVSSCSKRCAAAVMRSSPVEPCEEVGELMKGLGMSDKHLLRMSGVFLRLAQSETDDIIRTAFSVNFESVQQLIQTRRRWVARMLRCLLRLGGCEADGQVEWDDFLWIFIRFCSLSKEELCQALFIIITAEVNSRTLHYLTRQQLEDFFSFYEDCPVTSFDTMYIDFSRLPLNRYYIADFCELVTRFRQLLNPIIHLQQSLQSHMPGLDFWDYHTGSELFTRKITLEYFTMKRVRVHIRGEPPFRDSCDMLAPDALGCKPLNQDQWYLRARGLPQISVWAGQPTPEMAEAKARAEQAAKAKAKAEAEAELKRKQELERLGIIIEDDKPKDAQKKKIIPGVPLSADPNGKGGKGADGKGGKDANGKANGQNANATSGKGQANNGPNPTQLGKSNAAGPGPGPPIPGMPLGTTAQHISANTATGFGTMEKDGHHQGAPAVDGHKLSIEAACTDEVHRPPWNELPPLWMRCSGHVVAPAPQLRAPDPPLWLMEQQGQNYWDTGAQNMLTLEDDEEEDTALLTTEAARSPAGTTRGFNGFGRGTQGSGF